MSRSADVWVDGNEDKDKIDHFTSCAIARGKTLIPLPIAQSRWVKMTFDQICIIL